MENAFENLVYRCTNPNYKDTKILGDILFSNDELKFIAKPKSILFYILHPKMLLKDFYECNWKIGFLLLVKYIIVMKIHF